MDIREEMYRLAQDEHQLSRRVNEFMRAVQREIYDTVVLDVPETTTIGAYIPREARETVIETQPWRPTHIVLTSLTLKLLDLWERRWDSEHGKPRSLCGLTVIETLSDNMGLFEFYTVKALRK